METILLIEDNAELLDNTAEMLELANYKVVTAANGKLGLEKLRENKSRFSLVLCDIMMPELDGYGVLRAIGNMPEMKKIPFIFMTAKTEKEDIRKGMDLGADDYLLKPYTSEELLSTINARLLKAKSIEASSGGQDFSDFENSLGNSACETGGLIRERYRIKKFRKKETIYHEGDKATMVFYLVSGKVKAVKTNEGGKEYITNIYGTDQFLGYNALPETIAHNETTIVLEDCEVAILTRQDFIELLYMRKDVLAILSAASHRCSMKRRISF